MKTAKKFLIEQAQNLARVICQNDQDGPNAELQLQQLFSELTKLESMTVAAVLAHDMPLSDCYRMAAFFCPEHELLNFDATKYRRMLDNGNVNSVVFQLSQGTFDYSLGLIFLIEAGRSHSAFEINAQLKSIAEAGEQIEEVV